VSSASWKEARPALVSGLPSGFSVHTPGNSLLGKQWHEVDVVTKAVAQAVPTTQHLLGQTWRLAGRVTVGDGGKRPISSVFCSHLTDRPDGKWRVSARVRDVVPAAPGSGIRGDSKRGWAACTHVPHEDVAEARRGPQGGSCPESQPGRRAREQEKAQPARGAGLSREGPRVFAESLALPLSCEWDP